MVVLAFFVSTSVMAQCAYFYADQKISGRAENTDVFSVELSGNDALLNHVVSANGLFQIAYNGSNETLYLVNTSGTYFTTYNVATGTFGASTAISPSLRQVGQVQIAADGSLQISEIVGGRNYTVDVSTGVVAKAVTNGRVVGNNVLSRNYQSTSLNTNFSQLVNMSQGNGNNTNAPVSTSNGAALTQDGTVLTFVDNGFEFILVDGSTGIPTGETFAASLNGNPYLLDSDGCLTGSCLAASVPAPPPAPRCQSYELYYFSHPSDANAPKMTHLYGLDLSSGNGVLTLLDSFADATLHGALNSTDGLLYAIEERTGDLFVIDPTNGSLISRTATSITTSVSAVAMKDATTLVFGSAGSIKYLDINTLAITTFTSAPIRGGDLFYNDNGDLFLAANDATYATGDVYSISSTGVVTLAYNAAKVNGALTTENGNALLSLIGSPSFKEYDAAGNVVASYPAYLNGVPFTLENGDLAGACTASTPPVTGCQAYELYFFSHPSDVNAPEMTHIYGLDLSSGNGVLTLLDSFANTTLHGTFNEADGLLYAIDGQTGDLLVIDATNGSLVSRTATSITNAVSAVAMKDATTMVIGASGTISYLDINTLSITFFTNAPVSGGDLFYNDNGDLFLAANSASNTTGDVYSISNTGVVTLLYNSGRVNGSVATGSGSTLLSLIGSPAFTEYDSVGNLIASYPATLNGAPFTIEHGDLAAGCADNTPEPNEPESCDNFVTYFMSHGDASAIAYGTDIFGLSVVNDTAQLSLITNLPGHKIHGAFNEADGLLYTISEQDGKLRVFDPLTGDLLSTTTLSSEVLNVVAVAVKDANTLVMGNGRTNKVYYVDINTGVVTFFTNAPVEGGDLFYNNNGNLILAAISGSTGYTYNISPSGVVTQLDGNVRMNGAALDADGNYLVSPIDKNYFEVYSAGGSLLTSYPIMFNGAPYTMVYGDLASGCAAEPVVACDYAYFMTRGTTTGSEVFGVTLGGTTADLTLLASLNGDCHIAFNENTSELYILSNDGSSTVRTLNTLTNVLGAPVAISGATLLVQAGYDAENDILYVGDHTKDKIYTLDPSTGILTFVTNMSITGGDLVITESGKLLVVSNTANTITEVSLTGGSNTVLATFDSLTVGIAATADANLLVSTKLDDKLTLLDSTGAATGITYDLVYNGAPFIQNNGDLASGCGSFITNRLKTSGNEEATLAPESIAAMSIYPNPASDRVSVEFTAASETNDVEVMIYNTMGQTVQSSSFVGSVNTTIDVSDLLTGMYIVIVKESGAAAHTTKLIVE